MGNWFDRIGWALGFFMSVTFPRVSAPLNPALPFDLGGTVFGLLGFALMYAFVGKKDVPDRKKWYREAWLMAVGSALIGVIATAIYMQMLLSRAYVTPSKFAEWIEFILFCTSYFGVLAVIAFAYRNGGLWILRRLHQPPSPGA